MWLVLENNKYSHLFFIMFFGDGDAEDLFLFWVSCDIESRVDSTVVGLFFKDIVSL